jgi:predicted nucleotidyltransferase
MRETGPKLQGKVAEYLGVLREHLPELRERYGVESLGIFGPYVHGEQTKGSHLDLLVDFDRSIGLFDFVGLQEQLSNTLGVKVDLVKEQGLELQVGEQILAEVVRV